MGRRLSDIADATGLALLGDGSIEIDGLAAPALAGPTDLAVAMDPKYSAALSAAPCRAAVIWAGGDLAGLGLDGALVAQRPRVALAHLTGAFPPDQGLAPGVHPSAVIDPTAAIGEGAAIGPLTVIGPGATVGPGAQIHAHASIGARSRVGRGLVLHAGARIAADCRLGDNVIIQANAVIGSDGFSFEPPERGAVEAVRTTGSVDGAAKTARFLRIHSLAGVEIGDDVEIGANTAVDRGTLVPTRIGNGTNIQTLVQIGHNVEIGETCLICGQCGIAGSVKIGDRVVLGGKTGIGDHLELGSDVICAAGTLVGTNIKPGSVMMGAPAVPRARFIAQLMALRRMSKVLDDLAKIRKKLGL